MKIVTVGDANEFNGKLHAACMQRLIARWANDVRTSWGTTPPVHTIYMNLPERDGSQHWTMIVHADPDGIFVQGQSMVIGALLRAPDGEVEFHS